MQQKNIGAYLEFGSLALFARQIVEILQGAFAVAIHDTDGVLVWAGPNEGDGERCTINPATKKRAPGPGYCERLPSRNMAYVFYLVDADSDDLLGTLSVMVESPRPVSLEFAHRELQPILKCIEQQVAINAELSSVRRISTEGRDGLELLVKMDELDASAGPKIILQSVLKLAASHFGCKVAAVSLPKLGIQQAHPDNVLAEPGTGGRLVAMLDSLNLAASKYKKVLVSDDSVRAKEIKASDIDVSNVVCSPVVDSHDKVTGIFVLIGGHALPTESIRLVRAICAKINLLTAGADAMSQDRFSRHELLRHMNSVLTQHPDSPHAFLYLDIDKLHVVNDSYGHVAGDLVIQRAIDIVKDLAGENDAVAHLSGDRLGFFIQDCNEEQALAKAEHILQSLEQNSVKYDGLVIDISASIGVAILSELVKDGSAALSTAEVAARSAKERGGGRAVVFRDVDASVMQRRSDLDQVSNLQSAFIENRFILYAQTIQPLKEEEDSRRYEILVRMLDENGQLLLPAMFMSAAERYQMMIALDRWVINKTLDELANSDNMLEINLASFSINLSAQSLADDDFVDYLTQRIVESGVSPEALCFEITETALVRNLDRAQRFIRVLGNLGCRIALDDFGTGHCSFAYLKDMSVQYIKIDGVFIRDILDNPLSAAIVSSVTSIAKVMHAFTVAEHVENDKVLEHLRSHDIDFVQGFAIGRPRPLAEVIAEMGPAVLFDTTTNLVRSTS
jgi:diguanylate cyclase (GGDEF)-like protein